MFRVYSRSVQYFIDFEKCKIILSFAKKLKFFLTMVMYERKLLQMQYVTYMVCIWYTDTTQYDMHETVVCNLTL